MSQVSQASLVAQASLARLIQQNGIRRRWQPLWLQWTVSVSLALAAQRHLFAQAARGASGQGGEALPHEPVEMRALNAEYERFVRQHERQILNYLWRMLGDEQSACDLTQEVMLRAWQHFEAIRNYEQPRGWLFRVATNLALTQLKRRKVAGASTGMLDNANHPASSDPAWRLAESDLVRRTLLQLAPKRRAALVLREVYGLSAAEVGETLGMTETAVRMALHRGREQFRAIYLREGGSGDGA